MKTIQLMTLCTLLAASIPAMGQSHGHGGYYHGSHTSTYTAPSTYRPTPPPVTNTARPVAPRPTVNTARPTPARPTTNAYRPTTQAPSSQTGYMTNQPSSTSNVRPSQPAPAPGYDCQYTVTGRQLGCYEQRDMRNPVCSTDGNNFRTNVYSGNGAGLNNPAMQNVRNQGPTPQGTWNVTGVQQTMTRTNGTTFNSPNTLRLEPAPGTNTYQRDAFRVHGDNQAVNNTASNGCIIAPANTRATLTNMFRQGGQVRIQVAP